MMTQRVTQARFEEKFKTFVPNEMRVYTIVQRESSIKQHDDAGILVKTIAYLIDIGICVFIVPIFYNVYHYLKWGQTIGQSIMGIRIYRYQHYNHPQIASINQLIVRFSIKLGFIITWAVVGVTLTSVRFGGYPYGNAVDISYEMLYNAIMILWIHGYIMNMWVNEHRRGLHDIIAGTIVAYDHGYEVKKIILGTIGCICLYYFILILGPKILVYINDQFSGRSRMESYRSIRERIDFQILSTIYTLGLAKQ